MASTNAFLLLAAILVANAFYCSANNYGSIGQAKYSPVYTPPSQPPRPRPPTARPVVPKYMVVIPVKIIDPSALTSGVKYGSGYGGASSPPVQVANPPTSGYSSGYQAAPAAGKLSYAPVAQPPPPPPPKVLPQPIAPAPSAGYAKPPAPAPIPSPAPAPSPPSPPPVPKVPALKPTPVMTIASPVKTIKMPAYSIPAKPGYGVPSVPAPAPAVPSAPSSSATDSAAAAVSTSIETPAGTVDVSAAASASASGEGEAANVAVSATAHTDLPVESIDGIIGDPDGAATDPNSVLVLIPVTSKGTTMYVSKTVPLASIVSSALGPIVKPPASPPVAPSKPPKAPKAPKPPKGSHPPPPPATPAPAPVAPGSDSTQQLQQLIKNLVNEQLAAAFPGKELIVDKPQLVTAEAAAAAEASASLEESAPVATEAPGDGDDDEGEDDEEGDEEDDDDEEEEEEAEEEETTTEAPKPTGKRSKLPKKNQSDNRRRNLPKAIQALGQEASKSGKSSRSKPVDTFPAVIQMKTSSKSITSSTTVTSIINDEEENNDKRGSQDFSIPDGLGGMVAHSVFEHDKPVIMLDANKHKNQQLLKAISEVLTEYSRLHDLDKVDSNGKSLTSTSITSTASPIADPFVTHSWDGDDDEDGLNIDPALDSDSNSLLVNPKQSFKRKQQKKTSNSGNSNGSIE